MPTSGPPARLSEGRPTFSIVLPTRNRPHLLRYALRSALDQNFGDYEVVVSDNSSSEETAELVNELGDPRVRYFRTDGVLAMPDSWEFALRRARGEWVTFLCDDDAATPDLLSTVAASLTRQPTRLVVWGRAGYFHDTWVVPERRNIGKVPYLTGRIRSFPAIDIQRELFSLRQDSPFGLVRPLFLNSFARSDLIEEVTASYGRIFGAPCPDYACAPKLLSLAGTYTYIDRCLAVNGGAGESIGLATLTTRGKAHNEFLEEFGDNPILERVPLSAGVVINLITETLVRVRQQKPDLFPSIDIDWSWYFVRCYDELLLLRSRGVEVVDELRELEERIREFPLRCRARLASTKLRKGLRALVNSSSALTALETRLRRRDEWRPWHSLYVDGRDAGFTDIHQFARYLTLAHRP